MTLFGNRRTLRNRKQMRLPLHARDLDQRRLRRSAAKPAAAGPHTLISSSCASSRTTDGGALTSEASRGGKIGADLAVGLRQQAFENSVEQRDMLRIEMLRALREQRAELAHGDGTPLGA